MQRIPGITCLIVGVLFLVWGHNMAQSVGGQFQNAFTGSPGDKPMWLYIIGTILIITGLGQVVWKRK